MSEIKSTDVVVGRVFQARKPRPANGGFVNDRQVLYCDGATVQYDSPTVANGRRYPRVTMEQFLKWANHDVTAKVPKGTWRDWPI